jgi:hypothetical protein
MTWCEMLAACGVVAPFVGTPAPDERRGEGCAGLAMIARSDVGL